MCTLVCVCDVGVCALMCVCDIGIGTDSPQSSSNKSCNGLASSSLLPSPTPSMCACACVCVRGGECVFMYALPRKEGRQSAGDVERGWGVCVCVSCEWMGMVVCGLVWCDGV